ncbi:MAG: hypothetical protein IJK24_07615 [Oscillospiraceae bacterium]|nr:hypothetical protein [Oscillospiraceae bacterium]
MKQANEPPIGREQLREALELLRRYKAGKANLERRIVENEEFWKLRHWEHIPEQGTTPLKTKSAWLVNVLLSKHADAMDAYPEPAFLPRAADDEAEARLLSQVVPVILAQNDFAATWSDNWWKKLKAGVAFYGVFWDRDKLNGLGDVSIVRVDPLNLYWEPGVTELQRSRNLFHVELADNESLTERYPQLEGQLRGGGMSFSRYLYDDSVDTSRSTPVIDWYYKKREGRRTILHYVKFVGETVLFSTENEESKKEEVRSKMVSDGEGDNSYFLPLTSSLPERGLYDHGQYPFFADVLFPEEGTPAGFGYVDLCKDAQRQIDLMNNAIVANCVAAATPRWLKRGDDGVNEAEYADWTRPFVHVQGSIEENALRQITVAPLSGNYLNILASKINEIKETSGNRDVNNGGVGGGVTAASAIAAMQEQSGKLSRDQIQSAYRCFRQVVGCVISLIRQFYDTPRQLRVLGPEGETAYLSFDNRMLRAGEAPELDIEVSAQKQSSYNKLSYNEMALQFFQLGFFRPELADQALAALEMMDFKGKEALRRRVAENGGLQARLEQTEARLQSLLDLLGPAQSPESPTRQPLHADRPRKQAPRLKTHSYDVIGSELRKNNIAERARARAAAATQPR